MKTNQIIKLIHSIDTGGRPGTSHDYAPVLLFEKNVETGGKPSTWFPPGELVEQSADESQTWNPVNDQERTQDPHKSHGAGTL